MSCQMPGFNYFWQTAIFGFLDTSTLIEIYKKSNNRLTDEEIKSISGLQLQKIVDVTFS